MLRVKQYEQEFQQMESKRVSILKKLCMYGPFDDSIAIAHALGFKGYGESNLQIGTIGKYISEVSGVPSTYFRPAGVSF